VLGVRKLPGTVEAQVGSFVWIVPGVFPNLLPIDPVSQIIRTLWMMLVYLLNKTPMRLQGLLAFPNGRAIRLPAVLPDADVDRDFLFPARH
jgi:hypothetical protein